MVAMNGLQARAGWPDLGSSNRRAGRVRGRRGRHGPGLSTWRLNPAEAGCMKYI